MTRSLRHPVVARLDDDRSRSERIADGAVAAMGSMRFIVIQTAIVAAWIAVNVLAVTLRWDAYPFIALNLLFSTQAAYAAPLILLAARRADAKRDALAGHHYDEEQALEALLASNTALTKAIHDHILKPEPGLPDA
ncbi:MAG: hypothetical protein DLM54_03855 [Acidimicrobiales bacterium]|nr:MAG: hypothetical protein DLM54_03855 [Acidimicrobiales bacterium]